MNEMKLCQTEHELNCWTEYYDAVERGDKPFEIQKLDRPYNVGDMLLLGAVDYWDRDASPYVVHYVVDDEATYHCMPDAYKCWHVGSPGNARSLGIEMAEPSQIKYTSGASFTISDLAAAPAVPQADKLYRIRSDASGQIGAYSNLDYAKAACKDGYAVFDAAGNQVWPAVSYLVRVTAQGGLNIRKGPGTGYGVTMSLPNGGAYTIVEEQDGWGRLKSGAGWICLQYTEQV